MAKSARGAKKPSGRKPNPAFMKPMTPSPVLAEIIGELPVPRTVVVQKVWQYVKKKGLQESRNINADDKLRALFDGKSTVDMFQMMKFVNKHLSAATLGPDSGDKDPPPGPPRPPRPRKP